MFRSRLFWQLAGSYLVLVVAAVALPAWLGPLLGAVVVLLVLLAMLFLAAQFVRGVQQLAGAVKTTTDGAGVPPRASGLSDELADLSRAIAELARQQHEQQTQLLREQQATQEARQSADSANRARGDFLAILGHEIRTPLNGIMGMTQLALQTPLNAEQREYLEIVQSSADFLLAIINDLRDFAQLETGELRLQSVRFALRPMLAETLKLLGLRAHQKGLALLSRIAPDVPDMLEGDPDRLRQLLVNLLTNAINFTERGEVVLRVTRTQDRGSKTEATLAASFAVVALHFEVIDTGIGIPADKLALLLDTLPTDRPAASDGLGLSIARQLARGMGGRLWAESVVGQGSTFHFSARFQAVRNGGDPDPVSPQLAGVRVLLLDGNSTSREILQELLASWQMQPTAVASAEDALAALDRARGAGTSPALAVVDAHSADGFALVERIRQRAELASLPILMLISGHQPDDAIRCRQMAIPAHVTKPLDPAELLAGICKVLNLPAVPPAPAAGPRSLRVLVAEANSANRQLAVVVLEKLGHRVAQATTGREVLALLEQGGIDLLLLDPLLPEPSGLEVAAAIRAHEKSKGSHLPIIALVRYGLTDERERCREAGVDSYVAKPLQIQELVRAIESVALSGGG
jgi:signal transduction histidine kinase/CheY-like chemotaxis protein